jgi:hypothetical protein
LGAAKFSRRDAYNREAVTIKQQLPPDDIWIATKAPLP